MCPLCGVSDMTTVLQDMLVTAALSGIPVVANADHAPLEGGEDPAFGTVRWRTLFCADRTATAGMVMGIAEFGALGTLKPHRHGPAEMYFGLGGSGIVTIDGTAMRSARMWRFSSRRTPNMAPWRGPRGCGFSMSSRAIASRRSSTASRKADGRAGCLSPSCGKVLIAGS